MKARFRKVIRSVLVRKEKSTVDDIQTGSIYSCSEEW